MKEIEIDEKVGKPIRYNAIDDLSVEEERAIHHLSLIDDMDGKEYRDAVQNVKDISTTYASEIRQGLEWKKLELDTKKVELEQKRLDLEIKKITGNEIDPNVVITSGASIAAIILILNYERLHALTSKGLNVALRMLPRAI